MPQLRLTQGSLSNPTSLYYVEAVMVAPDDATLRSEIEHLKDGAEITEELLASRQTKRRLRDIQQGYKFGTIAGAIFNNLLGADDLDIKTSIAAARESLAWGLDRRIGESTIRNTVWPRYRCVAHLWAARSVTWDMYKDKGHPCRLENLRAFLAIAEAKRVKGEALRLARSRETALIPGECWTVPAAITLPNVDLSWELPPAN